MSYGLSPRAFRRKGRRALRRMSERQRAIFCAVRFDDASYVELAERHRISVGEVEAELTAALINLSRTLREPEPWWRRLWPW
jgi:DNA-directed RNA polymerase specialized sigma24 family protein